MNASQGLTLFLMDFIHYEMCNIKVNDISKVNHMIGIVTVMYKKSMQAMAMMSFYLVLYFIYQQQLFVFLVLNCIINDGVNIV